jgi:hypothetical protein
MTAWLLLFVDTRGRPVQAVQTAHSYNQKHVHNKSIAVLKNPLQNATYMQPIQ